ncbi:MAG: bifunctional hydroxymethylpyrimidine kinase/phosphomethylpyrimidine kinase [Clostridiales bacterium]|nr:bifunctional hydroxymethylpyrimidine kinase/phosphomethylpyrimidine kinase [Clostridiales bacterium]
MKTVLAISDSVDNTEFDLVRSTATIKDLGLDPMIVAPVFFRVDGSSEKNDVAEMLDYVFDECEAAAVGIGYLTDGDVVSSLAVKLESHSNVPIVAAPSIISDKGEILVTEDVFYNIIDLLLPKVGLLIINSLEAELLAGFECPQKDDFSSAAKKIAEEYGCNILIRGNERTEGQSVLLTDSGITWLEKTEIAPGFDTMKYNLFTAVACLKAQGYPDFEASRNAIEFCNGVAEKMEARRKEEASKKAKEDMEDLARKAKELQSFSRPRFTAPDIGMSRSRIPAPKEPESLVSPAKSIRDIARNIDFHKEDEPTAVTSAIEKKPEPRSEVSELSNPAERFNNELNSSILQLQSLKDRLNKMTGSGNN